MIDEELIDQLDELLRQSKETEWLEFKENCSKPDEIGEYISAIANSACLHDKSQGYLVFGVEDHTHKVKGTVFKPSHERRGNEELELWLANRLSPRIDFRIKEFNYNGLSVVMIIVDAAKSRPITFINTAYVRIGTSKRKLLDYPERERKIWQKASQLTFEKEVALSNLKGEDILKLLDFNSYLKLTRLNTSFEKEEILDRLLQERLIERNGRTYSILNAGVILLANNLRDFTTVSRKALRVIIYSGSDRLSAIKEREFPEGYAVVFKQAIDYIQDQLPQNEIIGQALRKEVKMYPAIAIREIVANALIHQDFTITGMGPMVEIFNNRIEFTNPGTPLIDVLRFIDHAPQSRNESIAAFARRAEISEERGSGIDKTLVAIEAYQLPAPKIMACDNYTQVTLYASKVLLKMDREDKIRACYQHCALRYVLGDTGPASNRTLRERFQVEEKNYSTISRVIADTLKVGLIKPYEPHNKARAHAKYVPFWAGKQTNLM